MEQSSISKPMKSTATSEKCGGSINSIDRQAVVIGKTIKESLKKMISYSMAERIYAVVATLAITVMVILLLKDE
jgi:hypothetical protein